MILAKVKVTRNKCSEVFYKIAVRKIFWKPLRRTHAVEFYFWYSCRPKIFFGVVSSWSTSDQLPFRQSNKVQAYPIITVYSRNFEKRIVVINYTTVKRLPTQTKSLNVSLNLKTLRVSTF